MSKPTSNWSRTLPLFPSVQYFFPFPLGPWDPRHCNASTFVPPGFPRHQLMQYALLISDEFIWYGCSLLSIEELGFAAVVFVANGADATNIASLTQGVGQQNPLTMPVFVTPLNTYLELIVPDMQAAQAAANGTFPQLQPVTLSTAYGNPAGECLGSLSVRIFNIVMAFVFLSCMYMAVILLAIDRRVGWRHYIYVGQGLLVCGQALFQCIMNPLFSYPWALKFYMPIPMASMPICFSTNLISAWLYATIALNLTRVHKRLGDAAVACLIAAYYGVVYTLFVAWMIAMYRIPLSDTDGISRKVHQMMNAYYYSNVACISIYLLTLTFCVVKLARVASSLGPAAKRTQLGNQLKVIVIFNAFQILGALIVVLQQFGWEFTSNDPDFNVAGRPEWQGFHCLNLYALYLGTAIESTSQVGFFYYMKVVKKSKAESEAAVSHRQSSATLDADKSGSNVASAEPEACSTAPKSSYDRGRSYDHRRSSRASSSSNETSLATMSSSVSNTRSVPAVGTSRLASDLEEQEQERGSCWV